MEKNNQCQGHQKFIIAVGEALHISPAMAEITAESILQHVTPEDLAQLVNEMPLRSLSKFN